MNNKGFAVSSILYTILICFLMFLGAAMAMFSSSNGLVVAANDDIINGTKLSAKKITSGEVCNGNDWNTYNDLLVKINSRYGVYYWPRDFYNSDNFIITSSKNGGKSYDGKLQLVDHNWNSKSETNWTSNNYDLRVWSNSEPLKFAFKDVLSGLKTSEIKFYNPCQ